MVTRKDILESADKCVNGDRDESYGSPENSFFTIAQFWNTYLTSRGGNYESFMAIDEKDVAAMLSLLKIARIAGGKYKTDNWVDLAGYAACGGEIESKHSEQDRMVYAHIM